MAPFDRVALVSLDPWDDVWRRNQHLSSRLLAAGAVSDITYISPPARGSRSTTSAAPENMMVLRPRRWLPRAWSSDRTVTIPLRHATRKADLLWINDPVLGVRLLRPGVPAIYDVTDDWRQTTMPRRTREDLVRAEEVLARRAATVVCSPELQGRWWSRYGVEAALVPNGYDEGRWTQPVRQRLLPGVAPHVGYIGSLHRERLDIDVVLHLCRSQSVGTVHLIGPDYLDDGSRTVLQAAGARLWGAVPHADVPAVTLGLDVLLSPHVVSPFTLSLDAIKAHEYLASGRPVVATATSGFQYLAAHPAVRLADRTSFVTVVETAIAGGRTSFEPVLGASWARRASEFERVLAILKNSS